MRSGPKENGSNGFMIAGLILAVCLSTATCDSLNNDVKLSGIVHPDGKAFAGSQSCGGCHSSIHDSHSKTPHFLTSHPADTASVKGNFDASRNTFTLGDGLEVVMQRKGDKLYQVGYVDGMEVNARPMDIVIGSGRKGQTFLYWNNSELFQLPVSYYSPLDAWCNSPGYPKDQILFNRNISGRCLECHGTFFKSEKSNDQAEVFDRNQVMLGVDCERCHGPAADHVTFHLAHPEERKAQRIINPDRLTRKQKLDNCALCHSGIRKMIRPSFSFIVGDKLEDYSIPDYAADEAANLDVHGNQFGLLTASECFRKSDMDCSSCHDVHVRETGNLELFSRRCMNCHAPGTPDFCKQIETPGLLLTSNCIDCHMPALPSSQVMLGMDDREQTIPDLVTTHRISIYSEEIKSYMKKIRED